VKEREREREGEEDGASPSPAKVRRVSARDTPRLFWRLTISGGVWLSQPVAAACERSFAVAISPLIGTGVTYRRAFTVRQRRCLLRDKLLLAALVRDISRYVWTIGPI